MNSNKKNSESSSRKTDHLDLAQKSQTHKEVLNNHFYYEPLFFSHETLKKTQSSHFLSHQFDYPFWISSMTGGTDEAKKINTHLSRLAFKYKLGFGLGSCRSLLTSDERLEDFQMRSIIGDRPFYANLGYAQVESLFLNNKLSHINELVKKLEVNGLIIHLNPLQEWFQPEGDKYQKSPIDILPYLFDELSCPLMMKEVGHGFGPKSLKAILDLPFEAVEFGAFGGTNFSLLESMRSEQVELKKEFAYVGHDVFEMLQFLRDLKPKNKNFIISGGMSSPIQAQKAYQLCESNKLIGLAYGFLRPARESFEALEQYFLQYVDSFLLAKEILILKDKK